MNGSDSLLTGQGTTADFKLEGDVDSTDIYLVMCRRPVITRIDNVALEPDEDFTLSFEVTAQNPDNILTGGGVVVVDELQVFIQDQTGKCVWVLR